MVAARGLRYPWPVAKQTPFPARGRGELQTKHLVAATGAGFVLTLIFIAVIALYSRDAPAANQTPVVVAIVALVGTLWTGSVTLAGIFLKDAVDRRNALFQAESERRLRMETALKAVEIMSKAEAEGVPVQESREAAILVVASLNHLRLALTLGQQFWQRGKISSAAFVQLVDQCLDSGTPELQAEATYTLRMNATRLIASSDHIDFPQMLDWSGDLPRAAKENILLALLNAVASRDRSSWGTGLLNWVLYALYKVTLSEPESRFRAFAALVTVELCDVLEQQPGDGILPPDRAPLTYSEARGTAVQALEALGSLDNVIGTVDYELLEKFRAWNAAADASAEPPDAALGAAPAEPGPEASAAGDADGSPAKN